MHMRDVHAMRGGRVGIGHHEELMLARQDSSLSLRRKHKERAQTPKESWLLQISCVRAVISPDVVVRPPYAYPVGRSVPWHLWQNRASFSPDLRA